MFFHMNLTVLLYFIYALTFDVSGKLTLTILILYWFFVLYFCVSCINKDYITLHYKTNFSLQKLF